jgi:hypothetical protein
MPCSGSTGNQPYISGPRRQTGGDPFRARISRFLAHALTRVLSRSLLPQNEKVPTAVTIPRLPNIHGVE